MFQAIATRYHGPTNTRGARISATWGSDRISIPYPHELSGGAGHKVAAEALRRKLLKSDPSLADGLAFRAPLVGAELDKGYVFIPDVAALRLADVLYARCALGRSGNPYSDETIRAGLKCLNPSGNYQDDDYKELVSPELKKAAAE